MKETAKARDVSKLMIQRLRLRRFSTVQLLIALGVLLIFSPFVEELRGGGLILSFLFSLVLLAAVFAVANRKRSLAIALVLAVPAIAGRWINHFRPDLIHPSVFSYLLAYAVGVRNRAYAAVRSARACGDRGSSLREHRGLPDAGLNVDGRVMACRSVNARRGLFFQHEWRRAIDKRIHRVLL